MTKGFKDWKILIGLVIAAACMFLAFRKVEFAQMGAALKQAKLWYIFPLLAVIFFSHWLRALRWRYLLKPLARIDLNTLFSSLLIGYMANTFLPAHLGEFVRAYLVAKKKPIAGSAVFATIVIERIIDVFTLLLLMALTVVVFPFPDWVRRSGYIIFAVIGALFAALVLMKKYREQSLNLTDRLLRPLPKSIRIKLNAMLHSFLDGVVGLQHPFDYPVVTVLSLAIWFCYGYVFQLGLQAFDFSLPWTAPLVLLVITTIAVLVPSSPGYVGTYHYLCQLALGLFGVPESEALTFALVVHGLNFLPILIVGLILVSVMGMNLKTIQRQAETFDHPMEKID